MKKEKNIFKGIKKIWEELDAMSIEKRIKKLGKGYVLRMLEYFDGKMPAEPDMMCPKCLRAIMEFVRKVKGDKTGWRCLGINCHFDFREFPELLLPSPDSIKACSQEKSGLTEQIKRFLKLK